MGERLGAAVDALDSAQASSEEDVLPSRYLKRQWLEFTLIRPGLPDRKLVRELARWRGDIAELRRSVARTALLRFETGAVGGAASLDRGFAALQRSLYWLGRREAGGTARRAGDDAAFAGTTPLDGFAFDAEMFLIASDAWADSLPDLVSYRPEPTVVARYLPLGRVDASRAGFDIITSNRAVLDPKKNMHAADALRIGVTDTWLEHLMFAELSEEPHSAYERLEKLQASELMLVRGADDARLRSIDPYVRERMADQLVSGHLLLVPRPADGRACEAWWAVNPATGTTLGMTSEGWGGVDMIFAVEMSEYLKDLLVTYGYTRTVAKVSGCTALYGFLVAAVKASILLQINEALDVANLGICNALPPSYQVPCQLVMGALVAASVTPAEFIENPVTFMRFCTATVF
jgi:hypothetical protein